MKKVLILIVILLLSISYAFGNETDGIEIYYNDEKIDFATDPIMNNDLLMVPMRQFFESFDAHVNWINDTREVLAYKGNTFIKLKIDDPISYNNGNKNTLKAAPIIDNSRTMVPVEFVAKTFDMDLTWNEERTRLDINNKYRDNIYSYLGETFFKKYYLKNEEIEFSLPYSWNKETENKYTADLYSGLQRYELSISSGYLEDETLDEYISRIQNTMQKNQTNEITFSSVGDVEFNDIIFKVLTIRSSNDIQESDRKILYFFEYDGRVHLFNFTYSGEIREEDAFSLTRVIMNSLKISTLTINRENEHYLEFKKYFDLNMTLESDLYANMDTNNQFLFKGQIDQSNTNILYAVVEKNKQRKTFEIPVIEGRFEKKIYVPFGLGKHNVTILSSNEIKENYNNQSIITMNKEDSNVIMQFSVVNLANENILYLIPSDVVNSKNDEIESAAKIITLNQSNSFDQAKALYKWLFNNIELIAKVATEDEALQEKASEDMTDTENDGEVLMDSDLTEETIISKPEVIELPEFIEPLASIDVFNSSQGNALELNVLYTALLRSIDIPARITQRLNADYDYSYQTEVYLNGRWVITDIVSEIKTYDENFSNVNFFNIYDQSYFEQFEHEHSLYNILDY